MKKNKKPQNNLLSFAVLLLFAGLTAIILLRDDIDNLAASPFVEETETSTQSPLSLKPRDKVINYHVAANDTITTLANKLGVSQNTIRWANNLKTDKLHEGQILKIPPVTGVVHTVKKGETVETIAAKYHTMPENILNFPFNDYADAETHALTPGQTLIVPNGRL